VSRLSLRSASARWVSTVLVLMLRMLAICLLVLPSAINYTKAFSPEGQRCRRAESPPDVFTFMPGLRSQQHYHDKARGQDDGGEG